MNISPGISRSLLGAVLAAALSATTLIAQQPPQTGYHSVACFKVKPDKSADFHKFVTEESHKLARGRIDDGELTTWYLLRAVLPQGSVAQCDYIIVAMFPGAPHLLGAQELSAGLKKAGMSISPDEYINHRNAVSTLVNVALFQSVLAVGSPQKGDYFRVNYMKAPDLGAYVDYEKKVLLPAFDAMTKDGAISAWSFNARVLPAGADQPFQAVTIESVSSMDAAVVFNAKFYDALRKTHQDMDLGTIGDQLGKLRTISLTELYQLEDSLTK
jgi:hypothetical protein